jgi:hypothetical protein
MTREKLAVLRPGIDSGLMTSRFDRRLIKSRLTP